MFKNTLISGLKFCFICFSAEHVNNPNTVLGDALWLFSLKFVVVMRKTWKFSPEISSRKVKKCAPLQRQFYSFGAPAGTLTILYRSLQRVGNASYAVCFLCASVLDTLCSLPGSIRQEKEPRFQITFKMAAMFDREILYPLYASRLAK